MRSYTLTPTRKPAGKALARRSRCALMSELLKDPANTKYLLRRIGILLRRELALMCSDQTNSILRSQSMSDLRNFTWNSLLSELSLKAPTLLPILQSCTYLSKPRQNRSAVIGMCSALLLKHRFSKMCIVQKVISLALASGGCRKLVYMMPTLLDFFLSKVVLL